MTQKICYIDKKFLSSSNNFLFENTFKVALQYLFNVFILLNIVSYLKLNFKLEIDPKMCIFKNLEEVFKVLKYFEKTSDNPDEYNFEYTSRKL